MKKIISIILCTFLVASTFVACSSKETATNNESIQIDGFTEGTYGGIEFENASDVVDYYIDAYNKTKEQTKEYSTADSEATMYSLLGSQKLNIENLLIEGKSISLIDNLVPTIMDSVWNVGLTGLPPCQNPEPTKDKYDDNGTNIDLTKSMLAAEDIQSCSVKDNGDGTITITLQPKDVNTSVIGKDSQGKFFNSMGDIAAGMDMVDMITWATGDSSSNVTASYSGDTGVVTIDTATGLITAADYTMIVDLSINHICVSVIKDKSASLTMKLEQHFPASEEEMQNAKVTTK